MYKLCYVMLTAVTPANDPASSVVTCFGAPVCAIRALDSSYLWQSWACQSVRIAWDRVAMEISVLARTQGM